MKKNLKKKRIIQVTGVILILIIALLSGGSLYLQWYALQAQGNPRGKDINGSYEYMYETYPHIRSWADSLRQHKALKDTFIVADDGTRLHALYAYADSVTDRTAVIVHGYTDNSVRMLHIGYLYHHDLKYNILLPDLRFSGLSEGTHLQMGWNDRLDVLRWMDVANGIFTRHGDSAKLRWWFTAYPWEVPQRCVSAANHSSLTCAALLRTADLPAYGTNSPVN